MEGLRRYAFARRWHVTLYQALAAFFTSHDQSDSALLLLPLLRGQALAPLSRTWPLPNNLTRLVCGDRVPPMLAVTPAVVRAGRLPRG